jgi:hypothetical protein
LRKIAAVPEPGRSPPFTDQEKTMNGGTPSPSAEGAAVAASLDFLDRDMTSNPAQVRPLDADLLRRAVDLVSGVKVDSTK